MSIIVAILGLGFLIFFHELGHFVACKLCHVGVLEFSIGMGPRIINRVIGKTRYSLKLLPIGGSCAMLGEDAAGSGDFTTATGVEISSSEDDGDTDAATLDNTATASGNTVATSGNTPAASGGAATSSDNMAAASNMAVASGDISTSSGDTTAVSGGATAASGDPWVDYDGVRFRKSELQDYNFQNKPAYQRFFICIAGVLNNFIIAAVFAGIVVFFCGFDNLYVTGTADNTPAATAGFQEGDSITHIGYHDRSLASTPGFRDLYIWLYVNSPDFDDTTVLDAVVVRDGAKQTITFSPYYDDTAQKYKLGISFYGGRFAASNLKEFLTDTFYEVRYNMSIVIQSFSMIFKGRIHRNEVMGPVGAVTVMGSTVEQSSKFGVLNAFVVLLELLVMLSSNLGIMNLLPIPALDGGRLIFILFEMISRRRLNPAIEERINQVGMMALLALMALIMSNDIWNIISGAYTSMLGG